MGWMDQVERPKGEGKKEGRQKQLQKIQRRKRHTTSSLGLLQTSAYCGKCFLLVSITCTSISQMVIFDALVLLGRPPSKDTT